MNFPFLHFFASIGVSSAVLLTGAFDNPLENPDFIYSDKAMQDHMQKAAASQQNRIEHAFVNARGEGLRESFVPLVADLWLGKDLDQVNETLLDIFTTDDEEIR